MYAALRFLKTGIFADALAQLTTRSNRFFLLFFCVIPLVFQGLDARGESSIPITVVPSVPAAPAPVEAAAVAEPAPAAVIPEEEVKPRGTGKMYQLYAEDIEKSIGDALAAEGAGQKVQATVVGRRSLPLYESDHALSVQVKTLRHDAQTQKWSANLLFLMDGKVESAMPVSGRYQELVALPVLKRKVDATEVISAGDIEDKYYPLARTRKDIVMDAGKLIGKSPRRSISANRPIREDEVTGALLLAKDALVRIRYNASGIVVETTGQALDAGALGDLVRVKNLDSKAIVQGVVEEKNVVRVNAGGQLSEPRTNPVTVNPPMAPKLQTGKTAETTTAP